MRNDVIINRIKGVQGDREVLENGREISIKTQRAKISMSLGPGQIKYSLNRT